MFEWAGLSLASWLILCLCSLAIGLSKAGLSGTALFIVPVMAVIFGGKASTGIVLPLLLVADVFAVSYYNRHASWRHILRLLPWALPGILIAAAVGSLISDEIFKRVMAVLILVGIAVMIWQDLKKKIEVPDFWALGASLGVTGGFATMMGNAAGPVMSLYLLAMRLPKLNFIGTAAWFFFLLNLIKMPFHVFFWHTISGHTLLINLIMAPVVLCGVFLGIKIVKIIPEKAYRILVIAATTISALFLFK